MAINDPVIYYTCDAADTRFLAGTVDEFRLYNRALTAGDVAQLFAFTGQSRVGGSSLGLGLTLNKG